MHEKSGAQPGLRTFLVVIVYAAVNALFGLLFRMFRKKVVIVFVKQFFDFLCQEEDGEDVRDNHH